MINSSTVRLYVCIDVVFPKIKINDDDMMMGMLIFRGVLLVYPNLPARMVSGCRS